MPADGAPPNPAGRQPGSGFHQGPAWRDLWARALPKGHIGIWDPEGATSVRLRITDNGRGLAPGAPAAADRDGHFGLRLLTDRVHDLGGRFSVSTLPGGGTVADAVLRAAGPG
ncbi:MAG TPA: hypothetical protein VFJ07_12110 [Streptosporangiaceae bacterium]|nr:hypothetical protein [Streptosporangiaceae bacterium]